MMFKSNVLLLKLFYFSSKVKCIQFRYLTPHLGFVSFISQIKIIGEIFCLMNVIFYPIWKYLNLQVKLEKSMIILIITNICQCQLSDKAMGITLPLRLMGFVYQFKTLLMEWIKWDINIKYIMIHIYHK